MPAARLWRLLRLGAAAAYALSTSALAALHFWPAGDSIPLLLLELGPRWIVALGFLPLLFMPMGARARLGAVAFAAMSTLALVDYRVAGCLAPGTSTGGELRVGTYNTGGGFVPPTELLLWYDEQRLDVALLQEMGRPQRLRDTAAALGMELLCRDKLCALTQHAITGELLLDRRDLQGWGGYAARFTLCRGQRCWPLFNIHLATPRHAIDEVLGRQPWAKAYGYLRVRELESSLAGLITEDPRAIIAGDFNMTQQSPLYREHWDRWQNAFGTAGCGFGYSKFTRWIATRIDHILTGSQWRVIDSRAHATLGGDHGPVTAVLAPRN